MNKIKTKREAAIRLQPLYNSLEPRKVTLSTLYRKIWFDGTNYRCSGKAHDYTI